MNSWKSPRLRYQWGLGNSISIRLHSSSAVTNKTTVLNTEHVGMHWASDFWSTDLHQGGLYKTKILKSGEFQFILPSVLLCEITIAHKENRFLSIMPFFLFSLWFAYCNNSMQLRKRKGWEACKKQWGELSNKKLPGCVSGLLAEHLLMRDGWCLCHLC